MNRKRAQLRYYGPAILLLDGFVGHHSDLIEEICEEQNIVLIFLPPHASDQVQPLDLGIFAQVKRWQSTVTVSDEMSTQTKQVIELIDAWRMATTPRDLIGAFPRAGIVTTWDRDKKMMITTVDPRYASCVRHYQHRDGSNENNQHVVRICI